jgi:plasmid maintenance system antidote protein VapI
VNTFEPDWVVKPGETLREWCEDNGLSAQVAAVACRRMKLETFEGILDGSIPITPVLAGALQAGTGVPARLWLNLERAYREGLAAGRVEA